MLFLKTQFQGLCQMCDKSSEYLINHYNDTCEIQKNSISNRNRLFIFLCLNMCVLYLFIISSDITVASIQSLLYNKFDIDTLFPSTVFLALSWSFFLYFSIRYIQTNISIERQYTYIHNIESDLQKQGLQIKREGSAYLKNYPFVLNYIDFLYKWVFPFVFIATVLLKIIIEIVKCTNIMGTAFDSIIAVLSLILWVSYLLFLHPVCIRKQK